jgi:hypothetical protein
MPTFMMNAVQKMHSKHQLFRTKMGGLTNSGDPGVFTKENGGEQLIEKWDEMWKNLVQYTLYNPLTNDQNVSSLIDAFCRSWPLIGEDKRNEGN